MIIPKYYVKFRSRLNNQIVTDNKEPIFSRWIAEKFRDKYTKFGYFAYVVCTRNILN